MREQAGYVECVVVADPEQPGLTDVERAGQILRQLRIEADGWSVEYICRHFQAVRAGQVAPNRSQKFQSARQELDSLG